MIMSKDEDKRCAQVAELLDRFWRKSETGVSCGARGLGILYSAITRMADLKITTYLIMQKICLIFLWNTGSFGGFIRKEKRTKWRSLKIMRRILHRSREKKGDEMC